ncbi:DUF1292 domain-containing protein [Bacillus sonorensis]|uniref:UPF0473 protein BSONL12_08942 n=1 Tax=Bacillus sonorensis L12 TaxID=1274524 RepID=M5PF13_9BACI|nr:MULTISPECIES: DUF1292 domain-containing protein [Bacillus]TWK79045.1 hypothetical protein CHCC20335_1983 [Bacillus paralicheniformis]EME75102.1 hypothetical protein BSONL12_08942 [Bacillus sonorensis L12]MBG9916003.1 hypothetical protein [Bacillus sonorensis]MCF7617535.1 DUF1292 domain-containing protein [Bacillus sonorensis]MCY7856251.1 DUF1292 domain-containing protein [Bacillus sonorensis]
MEHGEKNITIVDDKGNEQLCEVLFTFDSDQFNKSYVLYYPVEAQDEEEIEIHASSFIPNENGEDGELMPIETEEEWEMIEETLNTFLADEEEDEE